MVFNDISPNIHNQAETWSERLKKYGFSQEVCEVGHGIILDKVFEPTSYPKPIRKFRMVRSGKDFKLEDMYYAVLDHLRQDQGVTDFIKVTDDFNSSVASSFWGNMQQRLSIQQDRAQGFMITVNKFIKETFRIIHEMRQLDQRLSVYDTWEKTLKEDGKPSKSADNTLKALWTDFAEGGAKNPTSVIGLAQQVGYSYLPELFFNTIVRNTDEIDKVVDGINVNTNVKNIAKRKFFQFLTWKEKTHDELKRRRIFELQYLYQHWETTRMYITWIKPYLKNTQSLASAERMRTNAEVVGTFDSTVAEVEFMARAPKMDGYHPIIMCTFNYRSRAQSIYNQQYQNHTLVHAGRVEMNIRVYAWDEEEIDNYMKYRQEEEMEIIGLLDNNLLSVMDHLGDDFKKYIEAAGEASGVKSPKKKEEEAEAKKKEEKEAKKKKKDDRSLKEKAKDTVFGPFIILIEGLGEMVQTIIPFQAIFDEFFKEKKEESKGSRGAATLKGCLVGMLTYEIYKKSNRMFSW